MRTAQAVCPAGEIGAVRGKTLHDIRVQNEIQVKGLLQKCTKRGQECRARVLDAEPVDLAVFFSCQGVLAMNSMGWHSAPRETKPFVLAAGSLSRLPGSGGNQVEDQSFRLSHVDIFHIECQIIGPGVVMG